MTVRLTTRVLRSAVWVMAAASLQPISAQEARPHIRSVMHYTVKADRSGDVSAAIKEYNEILKKAMWDKGYTIWRSSTGPSEMVRVDYYEKWADLDRSLLKDPKLKEYQADFARISRRITDSFESSRRVIDLVNQEVSLPRTPQPPKMIMVWTAHVKVGKMADVVALEKNEYAPAVKSAGFKSYIFAVTRFGAPNNEIHSSVGLEKWADFDESNPVRKAMGDEKYRGFTQKMDALLDDYSYEVYRYDAELSYIPGK